MFIYLFIQASITVIIIPFSYLDSIFDFTCDNPYFVLKLILHVI